MAELQFAAFSDIIRDPWVTDERTYETILAPPVLWTRESSILCTDHSQT